MNLTETRLNINPNNLTTAAKTELLTSLKNNAQIETEVDVAELEQLTLQELQEIRSLNNLKGSGIDLYLEDDRLVIKKSKSGKRRDMVSLLVGILFSLNIPVVIKLWGAMADQDLDPNTLIRMGISAALAIYGVRLLMRTIERLMYYSKFRVEKSNTGITLSNRPDMKWEESRFSMDARLVLHTNKNKETLLSIRENEKKIVAIHFKNLDFNYREMLSSLTEIFNDYPNNRELF